MKGSSGTKGIFFIPREKFAKNIPEASAVISICLRKFPRERHLGGNFISDIALA